MAEAVAAFYTIETAIEGAAVGAFAVSRPTVPLHVRFRALSPLPPSNTTTGHSLDVVKGNAYVFGGDVVSGQPDADMKVVILPSDIENGQLDYQQIKPEVEDNRPLQKYTTSSSSHEALTIPQQTIQPRASHVSTSIDSNIFILAGRLPTQFKSEKPSSVAAGQFFGCDHVCLFSTQFNKWSVINADTSKCKDGMPAPRINASCTSTPHPQPDAAIDVTIHSHGTIFLHGGYDAQGQPLRDTWAFDVHSKVWSRWPDPPSPLPEEIAGEGRVVCIGKRLWRAGDGFGKMMYMDFDITRGGLVSDATRPYSGETSIIPQDPKWSALSFGDKAADTALQSEIGAGSEKPMLDRAETLPSPRQGAGFVPVRLSAGRLFLLYFMGNDGPGSVLGDVWSFQVQAEKTSAAAIKDAVRKAVGTGTGENRWARCEIIESTKDEGQVHPPRGLTGLAADVWQDLGGGNVVLWGSVDATGSVAPSCWVMSVE